MIMQTDSAPVIEVSCNGYTAWLASALWEKTNHRNTALMLNMVGAREAVRAIWANSSRHPIVLSLSNQRYELYFDAVRFQQGRLPSGQYQGLISFPELAKESIVLGVSEDELRTQLYFYLNANCQTPLHPSWEDWLWRACKPSLEFLEGFGISGVRISHDLPAFISDQVRAAVANGELTA